jgi:hypothetical protein
MRSPPINSQHRQSDFKIGQMHGRIPTEDCREAQIRNHLYLAGILTIHHTHMRKTRIRLVGYEVPLWKRGNRRDECIDLLGYDGDHRPWIIELKQADSNDKLSQVVAQLDGYAEAFKMGIRDQIEREVRQRFLWPDFRFAAGLGKMILADRRFFPKQQLLSPQREDILLCSYSKCPSEVTLLKGHPSEVGLKIEDLASRSKVGTQGDGR